jgi:hypothetical protein
MLHHIKTFNDAYSQSREYFFLDLLNQYEAPVPKVFRNDTQNKALEMQHVGINMNEWLHTLNSNAEQQVQAMRALHQAIICTQAIAQFGVWHLDLAFRNFMVDTSTSAHQPKVYVIDFTLAVAKQLPLQKPLWIRPDPHQHHIELQQAVIKDWNRFFNEAQILPPARFDYEFDIPVNVYASTWITDLAADQLANPWCVVAHSLGALLVEASSKPFFDTTARLQLKETGFSLQNLSAELLATNAINHAVTLTRTFGLQDTPRPRATQEPTPTPIPSSSSAAPGLVASPPSASHASGAGTEKHKNEKQFQQPAEQLPVVMKVEKVANASSTTTSRIMWVLRIGLIALSYSLVDALIWAYKLKISDFALWGLILVLVGTCLGLLACIFSQNRVNWAYRLIRLQVLSFLFFSLELWINDATQRWSIFSLICALAVLRISISKRT